MWSGAECSFELWRRSPAPLGMGVKLVAYPRHARLSDPTNNALWETADGSAFTVQIPKFCPLQIFVSSSIRVYFPPKPLFSLSLSPPPSFPLLLLYGGRTAVARISLL